MTDYADRPIESHEEMRARCDYVRAVIDEVRQDLTSWSLALGLGEPYQHHADRAYQRLEDLRPHDLTLAVALLLQPAAETSATHMRQWMWESTPKDYA